MQNNNLILLSPDITFPSGLMVESNEEVVEIQNVSDNHGSYQAARSSDLSQKEIELLIWEGWYQMKMLCLGESKWAFTG